MLGIKHTATNSLSRRLRTLLDNLDKELEEDVEDFINAQLAAIRIALIRKDTLPTTSLLKDLNKE